MMLSFFFFTQHYPRAGTGAGAGAGAGVSSMSVYLSEKETPPP